MWETKGQVCWPLDIDGPRGGQGSPVENDGADDDLMPGAPLAAP